jgi:hypothetical protein
MKKTSMKKTINTVFQNRIVLVIVMVIAMAFNRSGSFYSQSWQWAKSAAGAAGDFGTVCCTDPSGNIITTGVFASNPIQMGTVTLNNSGLNDVFLAKYNPNGTVLWAQKIGGLTQESISSVCTDAAGNIYVHGHFSSSVLSIPPFTISNFTTNATYDIFVACYNPSGIIQWLKSYGGPANDFSGGCAFSNSLSCLYISGRYNSSSMSIGTTTLINTDPAGTSTDIYLARFTPTGSVTWARTTGSSNSNDIAQDVAIDSNSDPYFSGTFSPGTGSTTVIGSTTLTTIGGQDMLIAKYNSAGIGQWAKNFGTSFNATADFMGGISIDANNNIFLNGYFIGGSLVAGTFTVSNSGSYDAFVAKTNSVGVFQWVNKIGGAVDEFANKITVDVNSNVYVTGSFSGTNIAIGTTTLVNSTPGPNSDIYVIKCNSAGVVQWAKSAGSSDTESGVGIANDAAGNVFVSGTINTAPVAFGTTTLSSSGSTEAFISKIGCLNAGILMPSSLCAGSSATLSATGATSYTWSTGATGSSLVVTPTVSTSYSVIGAIGTCTGSSSNFTLPVIPAFVNVGSNFNLLCSQSQAIVGSCTPSNPTSVVWTPTTGLSSSTVLSPTVTANGSTQYTVTANLSNGCVAKSTLLITQYAPTPNICMVTVDSLSTNNEVYWDKTSYSKVDSFIIYRETSTNVFKRIAAVGKNALSMYTDTARSIGPANGDPNFTSYKYKLQLRDSCGAYSPLSPWHQTIFNQDQQNGNFNWNAYAIEGATTTPVANYVLNRVNLTTGITTSVAATTGNSISDPQYAALFASNIKWLVDAQGFNCNPTAKVNGISALKTRTKSNQTNEKTFPVQGVKENNVSNLDVNIYPNPSINNFKIDFTNSVENVEMRLVDVTGKLIITQSVNGMHHTVNTNNIDNGLYFIQLYKNNKLVVTSKIVVQN